SPIARQTEPLIPIIDQPFWVVNNSHKSLICCARQAGKVENLFRS
ncbi:hypothetical protein M5D96_002152, partial [Drosophila gunungcola]